ncbi:MAG: hypothetical protein AAGI54_13035 [Planctomycetota bacterium]
MTQWIGVLDDLGRRARRLLILLRLTQWGAVLVGVAVGLGVLDRLLLLPGWLRLAIGVSVVAGALVWLATRLRRAAGFRVSRGELALRVERLYPQTRGWLASAVELVGLEEGGMAARLKGRLAERAEALAVQVRAGRVLKGQGVRRYGLGLAAGLAVVALVGGMAPATLTTAAQRWAMPLGDAAWPRAQRIEDATADRVWASDAAVLLRGRVVRGDRAGLRVTASYGEPTGLRGAGSSGVGRGWASVGLSRQGVSSEGGADAGLYEGVIEVPGWVRRELTASPGGVVEMGYALAGGDDTAGGGVARIAARPEVERLELTIEPPAYAVGWVEPRVLAWAAEDGDIGGLTAEALMGATAKVELTSTKPMSAEAWASALAPSLGWLGVDGGDESPEAMPRTWRGSGVVETTISGRVVLRDVHGLQSNDAVGVAIGAVADHEPTASVLEPSTDVTVLPTAAVPLTGVGRDDVGLAWVELRALIPGVADSASTETAEETLIARAEQRASRVECKAVLDLATYELPPGGVIEVVAVAQDIYALNGQTHAPVRSSVRRLRVVDSAALAGEIQAELGAVRRRAMRVEAGQRRLSPASSAASEQARIGDRVASEEAVVDRLRERAAMNRLDEPALTEVLTASGELLERAEAAANDAAEALREASDAEGTGDAARAEAQQERAAEGQRAAAEALAELGRLLDMSGDAVTLRLGLRALAERQAGLEREARRLIAETLGQDLDELDEETRQALDELADRQEQLAEEAERLTRQMQSTAAALEEDGGDDGSLASAMVLREAAEIALRQGLGEQMSEASDQASQGQLSRAAGSQASASATMARMMDAMEQRQRRQQELLERRLAELTETLRSLIARQAEHLERVEAGRAAAIAAAAWRALAESQSSIRVATMSAELTARGAESAESAVAAIVEAVDHQGRAVTALRASDGQAAMPEEREAGAALQRALDAVLALAEENDEAEAQRQREELRRQYEALAERQGGLIEQAEAQAEALNGRAARRARAALIALSGDQGELGDEVAALGESSGEASAVFAALHDWVEGSMDTAETALRRGRVDATVRLSQRDAQDGLLALAEALTDPPDEEPFEGQRSGGGGGGSGGSGEPELIPPIAELRAMRATQAALLAQTRVAAEGDNASEARLMALSTLQRKLSELGRDLVEEMHAATGGAPAGPAPRPDVDIDVEYDTEEAPR